MINIRDTFILDCVIMYPDVKHRDRGVFAEMFKRCAFPEFVPFQTNYEEAIAGAISGIHQTPYAKLISCLAGKVYIVCVDLRPESETYNSYIGTILDAKTLNSIYIPPNCGHGFFALEDCKLYHQQDSVYDPDNDVGYCWCDPTFNIIWPVAKPTVMSKRDQRSCEDFSKNVSTSEKPSIKQSES